MFFHNQYPGILGGPVVGPVVGTIVGTGVGLRFVYVSS